MIWRRFLEAFYRAFVYTLMVAFCFGIWYIIVITIKGGCNV